MEIDVRLDLSWWTSLFVLVICSIKLTDGRQMCWTCQYQGTVDLYSNPKINKDCVIAPANYTLAESRMKCPTRCVVNARFDAKTLTPTFFFRGCQDLKGKDECTKVGELWYNCLYTCGDGANYCNDKTSFELIEKAKKDKENAEKGDDTEDMTASLYCLVAIVAICAIGYFVKKRYCTSKDEDVDEGQPQL